MANVFEKVRDYLNQPLPGAPGKKAAAPKTAPKPPAKAGTTARTTTTSDQQKAPDTQTELRKRDLALRRARAKADMSTKLQLDKQRKELETLRHQYEAELAAQAKAHTEVPGWTHTVVPGDTLSGIAKKYYGRAARWPEIYEANKDKIKNPNLIYPGQVFAIPDED